MASGHKTSTPLTNSTAQTTIMVSTRKNNGNEKDDEQTPAAHVPSPVHKPPAGPPSPEEEKNETAPATHVRSPIRKAIFSSPATTSKPAPSAMAQATSVANKIFSVAIFGMMEVVLLFTDSTGEKGGWLYPLFEFIDLADNKKLKYKDLMCHWHGFLRSKTDPKKFHEDKATSTGFKVRHRVVVVSLTEEQAKNNKQHQRKRLAEGFCVINNSSKVQINYYKNRPGITKERDLLEYAGDLTPSDTDQLPKLSNYLTIGDTMDYICLSHSNETDGSNLTCFDVVANDDLLQQYYTADLIPKVKDIYREDSSTQSNNFNLPDLGF